MLIHPTAIIEPGAKLGVDVKVGPYSYIGQHVVLGDGCVVASQVVITGNTECGKGNSFHPFCAVGGEAQDKSDNDGARLIIGDRNIFRENFTAHSGTSKDRGITTIGSDGFFMAYSHVAHDAVIGDNVVFCNAAAVAGHVHVGDWAILSGNASVHQHCKIGTHAFIGGHSGVGQDILPFVMAIGAPAKPFSINIEGMRRRGFSQDDIKVAKRAYKIIFRNSLLLNDARATLSKMVGASDVVPTMLDFLNDASTRGFAR